MPLLKDILFQVSITEVIGNTYIDIAHITFNSNNASDSVLFIAQRGTQTDGHLFISNAIEKNASAIICERIPDNTVENVTYIKVKDSYIAAGIIASNFYNNPTQKLKVIGVTGTNGKTTVATLTYRMLRQLGYKVGLLSTVENRINDVIEPSTHTTPDAMVLQHYFSRMVEAGCEYCAMEVSSHALAQGRVSGVNFSIAGFTNLSHDHLDFHGSLQNYLDAKKKLFDQLSSDAIAISNADDLNGFMILNDTKGHKVTYALHSDASVKARVVENRFDGMIIQIDTFELHTYLVGEFNAYNITLVYCIGKSLGIDEINLLTVISLLQPVEGRFDLISNSHNIICIVDYAHTPDALENILSTIHKLRTRNEVLITVLGCGGDRDKVKRPRMGAIACEWSDKVILTSDNPRNESPAQIIEDMATGISHAMSRKVLKIVDRREAIRTACSLARPNDIICVVGKGHEKYQEVNGVKYSFDDKQILMDTLNSY